jgi:hypothetical protein
MYPQKVFLRSPDLQLTMQVSKRPEHQLKLNLRLRLHEAFFPISIHQFLKAPDNTRMQYLLQAFKMLRILRCVPPCCHWEVCQCATAGLPAVLDDGVVQGGAALVAQSGGAGTAGRIAGCD